MRHYATSCLPHQVDLLLKSMMRYCRPFTLHVLAWDWAPPVLAWGVPGESEVRVTTREALVKKHPHLDRLPGPPRTPVEEACSVRWRWFADVVARVWEHDGSSLMCVDGDTWFWSSPEDVWRELEAQSSPWALTEHRFPPASAGLPGATQESHGKYGTYNGGWAWFCHPEPARDVAALTEAWCRGTFLEYDGRPYFGDQGAIERIHEVIPAHVLQNPGVNLAPWNVHGWPLWSLEASLRGASPTPLVLYHYSSLRWNPDGSLLQLFDPGYALTVDHQRLLYDPYLAEWRAIRT